MNSATPPAAAVQILICDDYAPMRAMLQAVIDTRPGLAVCGEASNGAQAIVEAARLQPNVVLLDLAMPVKTGLEALLEIRQVAPAAKVVVFSGFSIASLGDEVLERGAVSYLSKGASAEAILEAIEAAARPMDDQHPPVALFESARPASSH